MAWYGRPLLELQTRCPRSCAEKSSKQTAESSKAEHLDHEGGHAGQEIQRTMLELSIRSVRNRTLCPCIPGAAACFARRHLRGVDSAQPYVDNAQWPGWTTIVARLPAPQAVRRRLLCLRP